MSILDWLTGGGSAERQQPVSEIDTVRKIADRLDQLEPDRARYIACFAYVLGRVAFADMHISKAETATMERAVVERGRLPEEQAVLVVQMAKTHNQLFGATDNFLVTREYKEISSVQQRRALLECLYAVASADHSISAEEDTEIRKIAGELKLEHRDFIAARSRYAEHLEVLKD